MRAQSRTVEEIVGGIAASQHGVATRSELLAAGVSRREIAGRLRNGGLLRVHPGVYRVGHRAPSTEATYLAAVKACGQDAVLSGRAAGHLWRLLKGRPPSPEVTARTQRRVAGLLTRRCRSLERRDVTTWRGIPVTTVPRTLVDLAAALDEEQLARACHEAGVLHGTTPAQVKAVLVRRPNATGGARLRAVLYGDVRVTLSRLERRFLELLREIGRPLPHTNKVVDAHRVDCRWPEHRLAVELDSYRYHGSLHAWQQDHRRERAAYARGDDHRRYTHEDVFEDPRLMLAELRELLPPEVRSKAP
jgi:very-short-patch-repair endonuclease